MHSRTRVVAAPHFSLAAGGNSQRIRSGSEQKPETVWQVVVKKSAQQLKNFFTASVGLMKVMAKTCEHEHVNEFYFNDLSTWKYEMHWLSGVPVAVVSEQAD